MDWVIVIAICATPASAHLYNYQLGMRENFIIDSKNELTYHIEKDILHDGRFIIARQSNIFSTDGRLQENIVGSPTGITGYHEGVREAARLNGIAGFVQLNSSSIVVADEWNHCLRHINRETKQTTPFAGTCQTFGYRDGLNTALFHYPGGVLLSGNVIFVADGNHAVRTVDKHSRTVMTLARDETALQRVVYLLFESPASLIASTWGSGIARINTQSGQVTTLTGKMQGSFDGVLNHATFYRPSGLVWLDHNLLLVADSGNSRLRLMDFDTATTSTLCASARLHEASGDCSFNGIRSLLYTDGFLFMSLTGREQRLRISRVDLDECQLGNHSCPAHSICSNTNGSYTCACAPGYTGNSSVCEDVDECQLSMDTCHSNATCINIDSSFVCLCPGGFTGDGMSCEDINECSGEASPCEEDYECVNTVGAFYCRCHPSSTTTNMAPTQITDLDECQLGNHSCPAHSLCSNTDVSYKCACAPGYTGNSTMCEDVNECQLSLDTCHGNATCINIDSSFVCLCSAGFTGDGVFCEDINECSGEARPCEENYECVNTVGAFYCRCHPSSTTITMTPTQITDVDECESVAHRCPAHSVCSNTDGSYTCTCSAGFTGINSICEDIDECQLGNHFCPEHSMCSNTYGSYTCPCAPGYRGNSSMCEDIDECQLSMDTCHSNATCINIDSSFVCLCSAGYTGDGVSCEDINECSGELRPCEENYECVNIVGAFYCRCRPSSTTITMTPTQITDVAECESVAHHCPAHSVCSVIDGFYTCICSAGFTGTSSMCEDLDECHMENRVCHINAKCINMESTFACLCLAGFTGDGAVCQDIDECAAEMTPCEPTAECINTDGAFGCAYPSWNVSVTEITTNISAYSGLHEDINRSCAYSTNSSLTIIAGVVCFVLLAVIFGLSVKLLRLRAPCRRFAASYTLPYERSISYSVKSDDPLYADSEGGLNPSSAANQTYNTHE